MPPLLVNEGKDDVRWLACGSGRNSRRGEAEKQRSSQHGDWKEKGDGTVAETERRLLLRSR